MKKIGIIGAMELEVETLKSKMNVAKTTKKANMEFFEGILNGVEVVIVRSGIGKVNAGICTQILADIFNVTHIINTGIAGSLDAQIDIGDIVVSTDVLQHDMDVRVFGYPLGEIPQLGTLSFPGLTSGCLLLRRASARKSMRVSRYFLAELSAETSSSVIKR